GKFADALTRFGAFQQQYPRFQLALDAQLRQGFCQVQLKQFQEAIRTLQPLADKEPRLADQALLWIGKAQAGSADPTNVQTHEQTLRTPMDTFPRAPDRANQLAATDPEAKSRRGEILLELADTQQQAKQYKEAAATCEQILNEKLLTDRDEEVLQRQITAVQLAGDYPRCDQLVARFQQTYPKSTLLPAVLFRHAENAYFQALAVDKNPNQPTRVQEMSRLYDEAGKRYQAVIDKYPEFAHVNVARYGLAMTWYRKGDCEKAHKALQAIPQDARQGDLASTPYLLADCI